MVSYFIFCLLVAMVTTWRDVSGDDVVADACSPLCPEETIIEAVCGELSGCSNLSATTNPEEFINCWTPCWVLADSCFSLCAYLYNILVQKCFTICKVTSDLELCISPCFDISFLDIKQRFITGQLSFTEILNEPESPSEGSPSQPLSTKSLSELLSTKSPFKLTSGKSLSQLFLTKPPSVQSSTKPPPKSTQNETLSGIILAPKNSQISSLMNEPQETATPKTKEQAEDSLDPKFATSPSLENNEFNPRPQTGLFLKNKYLWKKIQQFHHRRNRLNLETMKKYHEIFNKINFFLTNHSTTQ